MECVDDALDANAATLCRDVPITRQRSINRQILTARTKLGLLETNSGVFHHKTSSDECRSSELYFSPSILGAPFSLKAEKRAPASYCSHVLLFQSIMNSEWNRTCRFDHPNNRESAMQDIEDYQVSAK